MTATRRQKIEAMLVDEPADTFLRYSLAMELDKEGQNERSLAEFQTLMRASPPYVPAFFMAAQQLARLKTLCKEKQAHEHNHHGSQAVKHARRGAAQVRLP